MIPRELERAVRSAATGETEGLFLLHGEEEFLVSEAARAIVATLCERGARESKTIRGGKGEVEAIAAEMSALSFLAPEIVVHVKGSELFGEGNEQDAEAFVGWLGKTPRLSHPLIFAVHDRRGDRGGVDKRRRAYKAVEKRGVVHEFAAMKEDEAADWVIERGRAVGAQMDRSTARLLIERTGVSLGVLSQEIEKLALYVDGRRVDREALETLVGPSREEAIWSLTDHVLAGQPALALRDLGRLIDRSGENPLGILLWLAREFRALLEARALLAHPLCTRAGRMAANPASIQSQFVRRLSQQERAGLVAEGYAIVNMHPWALSVRLAAAMRFREERLRDALVAIAAAERDLKLAGGVRERGLLEEIVLALAASDAALSEVR